MPKTMVSSSVEDLKSMFKKHATLVLKPLYCKGGEGIHKFSSKDKKAFVTFKKLLFKYKSPIVIQKFIKNVKFANSLKIRGTPTFIIGQQILPGAYDYEKLKKAWKARGVELPDNSDDIDWNNPPFDKWMNRYGFGGGDGRPRSNRLSPGPEREYMREHFTKSGQNVPTIEEQEEVDETLDEARMLSKEQN